MDRLVDTFIGIDPELLHQADQVLAKKGVSLAQAVRGFLEQVVRDGQLPAAAAGTDTAPAPAAETVRARRLVAAEHTEAGLPPATDSARLPEAAPAAAGKSDTAGSAPGTAFDKAVHEVAKGTVYTPAEIKAYLQQMDEF